MLSLFHSLHQQVWTLAMLLVSGFALWRGGWPERTVAVANIVASLLNGLLQNRQDWLDPQWADLGVDVLFLVLLVGLALWSRRSWLLFAAAFQLLGVVVHAAMMVDRKVSPWAYITGGVIFSYLVLIALAVGTWAHWRRSRLETVAGPDYKGT